MNFYIFFIKIHYIISEYFSDFRIRLVMIGLTECNNCSFVVWLDKFLLNSGLKGLKLSIQFGV